MRDFVIWPLQDYPSYLRYRVMSAIANLPRNEVCLEISSELHEPSLVNDQNHKWRAFIYSWHLDHEFRVWTQDKDNRRYGIPVGAIPCPHCEQNTSVFEHCSMDINTIGFGVAAQVRFLDKATREALVKALAQTDAIESMFVEVDAAMIRGLVKDERPFVIQN